MPAASIRSARQRRIIRSARSSRRPARSICSAAAAIWSAQPGGDAPARPPATRWRCRWRRRRPSPHCAARAGRPSGGGARRPVGRWRCAWRSQKLPPGLWDAAQSSRRRPNTTRQPRWCRRPSWRWRERENAIGQLSRPVGAVARGAGIAALALPAVGRAALPEVLRRRPDIAQAEYRRPPATRVWWRRLCKILPRIDLARRSASWR